MISYYLFWGGLFVVVVACVMLIDKGPPREGMHPYQYGGRRVDEWMRPKFFALGSLMLVASALLWLLQAVLD